ncbi:unnamed protein product [Rotaria sp. Silwood2]|nr:unnamed protein product [Rotaria sp. Silwood2]
MYYLVDGGASPRHFVHHSPPVPATQTPPKLPPRQPPPPPPSQPSSSKSILSSENKLKTGQESQNFSSSTGLQPNVSRVLLPPPPPPPSNSSSASNNNGHTATVTLNPDHVAKFNMIFNQNGPSSSNPSPPPPPPPRGMVSNNSGGTIRRPPPPVSDFVDNTPADRRYDQWNTAALDYDRDFENRFRFTPIEHLPAPGQWKPSSSNKPSKNSNFN